VAEIAKSESFICHKCKKNIKGDFLVKNNLFLHPRCAKGVTHPKQFSYVTLRVKFIEAATVK
jgi:hypothetical protein